MQNNNTYAWRFAKAEMIDAGETLHRAEAVGPFVVALVELAGGGYQNRVSQPSVIERNQSSNVALLAVVDTYGLAKYDVAARRFNKLVDDELV